MRLYRKKGSPYWWVVGYDATRTRRWESTKQRDKAAARRVAELIQRRWLLEGTDRRAPLPLTEALGLLKAHKQRRGCAVATMEILAEKGGRLLSVFGPTRDVGALTLSDTEDYLDVRRRDGVSLHTIAKELGTLRSAMRQARRHGLYTGEPADVWPEALRDVYRPRTRWLTIEEYRRLSLALAPKRREHLAVYCYTGLRLSELYRIRGEHVDLKRGVIQVPGTKTEKAQRVVPIAPDIRAIVAARRHVGRPLFEDEWSKSWMRRELAFACDAARMKPVTANDLRRTFCSWCANSGVPEGVTVRMMGHASTTMVRRVYAQLAPETLVSAGEMLPRVTDVPQHSTRSARPKRSVRGGKPQK